jgi:periplasmic protein TonB
MSTDDRPRSPQSWEHLLQKDPHGGRRFRLGIMAAALIHAGIFAVTWPTIAQAPPEEPEQILIPVQLVNLIPPEREPEPILIEAPPPRPEMPVIAGPPEKPSEPVAHRQEDQIEMPNGPVVYVPPTEDLPPPPVVVEKTIVHAGHDIPEPEIIHKVEPRYTQPAIKAGIQGVVILELIIDPQGRVESADALRGLPLGLTKSALDAVKQWRFQPSTYNDHPVSVRYILTVNFHLK